MNEDGQRRMEAEIVRMDWAQQHGVYDCWYRPGWFVQMLANGLWICGQNPAEPASWTSAELLYKSREDAMQACNRRAAAAEERKAAKVREWLS